MRTSAIQRKGIKEIVLELRRMMEISKKSKAWTIKRKNQIHKALEYKIRALWLWNGIIAETDRGLNQSNLWSFDLNIPWMKSPPNISPG
jgi:putative protein kinase ArgK-like GTPase of G3E family